MKEGDAGLDEAAVARFKREFRTGILNVLFLGVGLFTFAAWLLSDLQYRPDSALGIALGVIAATAFVVRAPPMPWHFGPMFSGPPSRPTEKQKVLQEAACRLRSQVGIVVSGCFLASLALLYGTGGNLGMLASRFPRYQVDVVITLFFVGCLATLPSLALADWFIILRRLRPKV